MLAVELKHENAIKYPETTQCFCGSTSNLKYKTVSEKYGDRVIKVRNVPVYECPSLHVDMARITRVKLKKLRKIADMKNQTVIQYR